MILYRAHCDAEERILKGEEIPFNCAFNSKLLSEFKELYDLDLSKHQNNTRYSFCASITQVRNDHGLNIQESVKIKAQQLENNVHKRKLYNLVDNGLISLCSYH